MSEPFLGEIRMFAGNFAPRSWAFCDGQLLATNQYDALFSLLGTMYGGDGRTTFGLPDMRGRIPVHVGQSRNLDLGDPILLGQKGGAEESKLTVNQLPWHVHGVDVTAASQDATSTLRFAENGANQSTVAGNSLATTRGGEERFSMAAVDGEMASGTVAVSGHSEAVGGSQSHSNMPPFVCINFIIALSGIYPSRS